MNTNKEKSTLGRRGIPEESCEQGRRINEEEGTE
jgi:hypothetical protein